MICPFCGGEIPEGSKECFICGEYIFQKEPESSLGRGITIIPNSNAENDKTQGPGGSQYMSPMDYSVSQDYGAVDYSSKSSDGKRLGLLIAFLAVVVIAIIAVVKSGAFASKDGVYNVQNLDEVFDKIIAAEGETIDTSLIGIEASMTIDGKNVSFRTAVLFQGEVYSENIWHGEITFSGKNVSIKWDDRSGMGVATYNSKDKSITFDLEPEDAAYYGLESLVFVRE
jgi:hypothetical protein